MFNWIKRKIKRRYLNKDIDPEDIFVEAENLPAFDRTQLEGRLEKPISRFSLVGVVIVFLIFGFIFIGKSWNLQISNGEDNFERSTNNRLRFSKVFADRGIVYDKDENPLIWNKPRETGDDFSLREYVDEKGFAHILGYVKYPQKDKSGFYYTDVFKGFGGIEEYYNNLIAGENGKKIIETNARQEVVTDNTVSNPKTGERLDLTIDSELQTVLYESIESISKEVGFQGGAGIILNPKTGDVYALVSYPEFNPAVITAGTNTEEIEKMFNDNGNLFLNRALKGLYTPGSIMKPYVALAGLQEGVISPYTEVLSVKRMLVPNPYNPDQPSVFTDWKAHGYVDVKKALAYSSNVFFYQVGGGYSQTGQKGVGISNLEKYFKKFGFGKEFEREFFKGPEGTIPNPEWKEKMFDGDIWRLGDTYFTSIGQYGLQVTPIQVARALTALVNNGRRVEPKINKSEDVKEILITDIDDRNYKIVKSGMRDVVLYGTGKGLDIPEVNIAAKTGTAELGVSKASVNSWATGFFPYEDPEYAFVIVMEKGSRTNLIGGVAVMRKVLDWMRSGENKGVYF